MKNTRLEADSIGVMEVPETAYYGVQSLRAKENFQITNQPLHPEFIKSIVKIKKAAAITNCNAGKLSINLTSAIIKACDEIINGKLMDEFIVDAIQGGAGTSANMNANEVIANRAIELMECRKGDYSIIHPNDHVNMAQSTNDVIPSAGKLTVLQLMKHTITELKRLQSAMLEKSIEFNHVLKMGRTQLQDAVPMKLGQSFHAYASVIERDIERITDVQKYMRVLNMGGTAIGTGINVPPAYLKNICRNISSVVGENFEQAEDLFDATQNVDGFVMVSGVIKTCAVNLSKICNDLRLLSSGPRTGFHEINLPAMQNGSSIMPGKVNPVIPEVVSQVAFHIVGCDASITMAAEAGQMELNAFEPVMFYNLFEAIETLGNAAETLTVNCIIGITANEERCSELVNASVGISTALCPYIGYKKSAAIAKESLKTGISVKDLVVQKQFLTQNEVAEILNPEVMIQAQRYELAR
jgi:aspartate ammonia-lyase